MTLDDTLDRRVRRTQMAIFDAFRELVLSRRYDDIRVADIIERADVGRSTFYDNFKSKDDVLLTSIEPLFDILAQSAAGRGDEDALNFVVTHFWEQRSFARIMFNGETFEKLTRKLAAMIAVALNEPDAAQTRLRATSLAAAQMWALRIWLSGEVQASSSDLVVFLNRPVA